VKNITIRRLQRKDCEIISQSFAKQGWNKPKEQYENYFEEQEKGKRVVIIAEYCKKFAGYVTIKWDSIYPAFKERNIPEIKDLNVLIKYRKNRIGTMLINEAEKIVKCRSELVGLRVGLTSDYGVAQALYIKRGYMPDKLGIHYKNRQLNYGEEIFVDDELTLGFIKNL
jgi:ribosomal protein S18 acetylase RimI-like enzyme